MPLAGLQTDAAELVCAVTGTAGPCMQQEAVREKREMREEGKNR